MSTEAITKHTSIVEYWHDHLSVETIVNLLNENGFTVEKVVHGKCTTASSYPIVICYVTKNVLVSETDRMTALLKSQGITCFRVEGCYQSDLRPTIELVGSVMEFAKPDELAEAIRNAAAIEG